MAAVSGAPSMQPRSLAGLAAVEDYIALHHTPGMSWHFTLNNHALTRPKEHGGSSANSVKACKTFQQAGGGGWRCNVDLPNSFALGDGCQLHGVGAGATQQEASENACRHAMAQLLMFDASQVALRPKHWAIELSALVAGLPGVGAKHQALPVHVPLRNREAGMEAAMLSSD